MHAPRPLFQRLGGGTRQRCRKPGAHRSGIDDPLTEQRATVKQPIAGNRFNQVKGMVWELGYLGNRSTYRIKTQTGKLVTVFAQNDQRTSEWSIDWSDEVYLSWTANCAVLLQQ